MSARRTSESEVVPEATPSHNSETDHKKKPRGRFAGLRSRIKTCANQVRRRGRAKRSDSEKDQLKDNACKGFYNASFRENEQYTFTDTSVDAHGNRAVAGGQRLRQQVSDNSVKRRPMPCPRSPKSLGSADSEVVTNVYDDIMRAVGIQEDSDEEDIGVYEEVVPHPDTGMPVRLVEGSHQLPAQRVPKPARSHQVTASTHDVQNTESGYVAITPQPHTKVQAPQYTPMSIDFTTPTSARNRPRTIVRSLSFEARTSQV